MARPPIIISNQGLLDLLIQNIVGDVQGTIRQRIIDLNNVAINAGEDEELPYPVMSRIKSKKDNDKKIPKYIWHLNSESIKDLNKSIQETWKYDGEVDPERYMEE